jgi:hypothetical protein
MRSIGIDRDKVAAEALLVLDYENEWCRHG